ncbi:MAG: hypothetical protein RSB99_03900 [Bacilli bacterium]
MNNKDEKKTSSTKKAFKVDKTVILCAIAIIVLALLAIIPPMLRVFIPVDYFEPVKTPEVIINEKVVVCTKNNMDENQVKNTYEEKYYMRDDMLYKSETVITNLATEFSLIKKSELIHLCGLSILPYKDINGVKSDCNADGVDQVVRILNIDYMTTKLEDLVNTKADFVLNSSLAKVVSLKEADNYICK